jgi:hypothetical protein
MKMRLACSFHEKGFLIVASPAALIEHGPFSPKSATCPCGDGREW